MLLMSELNYGDKVVVRYTGRELAAMQIERLSRAPVAAPVPEPTDTPLPPELPLPPLE